jgi:glutamine amidotransferase
MCRFIAYLGRPLLAENVLVKPANSLINQSINALETSVPVNGDGFGLGWYQKSIRPEPGRYVSIQPAWNDENLLYAAALLKSSCFLAHVRAATQGRVSLENCHPFHYEEFLMMQNGGITEFYKIKRAISRLLDDDAFDWIKGQTDTEYILGLFMTIARQRAGNRLLHLSELVECLQQTFEKIEELKAALGLDHPSLYNLVLTNGEAMLATRYSTQPDAESRSLHLATGAECYTTDSGEFRLKEAETDFSGVLLASEQLTDDDEFWQDVPLNHYVTINRHLEVKMAPM